MSGIFETLPSELIEAVLDQIRSGDSIENDIDPIAIRALRTLTLTSKRLLHIARPRLYKSISLNSGTLHRFSTIRLARTLCKAPHLALLIRNVSVRWCIHRNVHKKSSFHLRRPLYGNGHYHVRPGVRYPLKPYDSADAMLFQHALKSIDWHEEVQNRLAINLTTKELDPENSCGGAEVLVVLALATQLKKAYIESSGAINCACTNLCALLLRPIWAQQSPGLYDLLEEVEIDGMMDAQGPFPDRTRNGALSNMLPAASLSGLKKMTMRGLDPTRGSRVLQTHFVGSAWRSVTSLTLAESTVDSMVLQGVIGALPSLEKFRYEVQNSPYRSEHPMSWSQSRQTVDIGLLRPALELRKETLRRLSITNLGDHGQIYRGPAGLGSLKSLHKLTHLELDEQVLVHHTGRLHLVEYGTSLVCQTLDINSLLPTSLKTLVLHTYTNTGDLGAILLRLSTPRAQELEQLEVTFSVYPYRERSSGRARCGDLTGNCARFFTASTAMSTHDRRYRFEYKPNSGGTRITFRCWDLKLWAPSELEELALGISERGIKHFPRQQRGSIWDNDSVLGVALGNVMEVKNTLDLQEADSSGITDADDDGEDYETSSSLD